VPSGLLSRALRRVESPANIGRRQVHREGILQHVDELNEFAGGTPAREERKLVRLENRVCLEKRKDATGRHFGPDLPQDLEEADGAEVTHHGGVVSLLLDEGQQNSLPLVRGRRCRPELLQVDKDLLLNREGGNLKETVGHPRFTRS
jgi:hypothetical protein